MQYVILAHSIYKVDQLLILTTRKSNVWGDILFTLSPRYFPDKESALTVAQSFSPRLNPQVRSEEEYEKIRSKREASWEKRLIEMGAQ